MEKQIILILEYILYLHSVANIDWESGKGDFSV